MLGRMITRSFPILATPNLERIVAFYVGLLGGTISYRFPPTGAPAYVTIRLGASRIGFAANEQAGPATERFDLCAYTKDVDVAVKKLRGAGVHILLEPADQDWGERMARIADPDGNRVTLFAGE